MISLGKRSVAKVPKPGESGGSKSGGSKSGRRAYGIRTQGADFGERKSDEMSRKDGSQAKESSPTLSH